jgi:hypothetical protein
MLRILVFYAKFHYSGGQGHRGNAMNAINYVSQAGFSSSLESTIFDSSL